MVRRQRLHVEHIETGSGDAPGLQGGDKGSLVHNRSSGRIDQDSRGLHDAEFALANHAAGFVREPQMKADNIAFTEQRFKWDGLKAEFGFGAPGPGDDAHPDGCSKLSKPAANCAEPDNSERLAV